MADFKTALKKTKRTEGIYANDSSDRGGETFMGISRVHHPKWEGWQIIDRLKAKGTFPTIIPVALVLEVDDFYRHEFWNKISGDHIGDQAVADELFDTAVNMGWKAAGKYLQRGLNLLNRQGKDYSDISIDGRIGARTIAALDHCLERRGNKNLLKLLNHFQAHRYVKLAEKYPDQEDNMNGWLTRV